MSQTFCPLPWMFQAVRNNGDFRICCQANVSPTRGVLPMANGVNANAGVDDPVEARNLPLMKQTRQQMLRGEWPASCSRCQEEEASGLRSRRIYENQNWGQVIDPEKAARATQEDGTLDVAASPVQSYDLRFGNKCNLKCRMCGPSDSDFWYDDHVALHGPRFWDTQGEIKLESDEQGRWTAQDPGYSWYERGDKFWQQMEAGWPALRHLHIVGGEPLLLKKHYELLERLVETGHSSHITLEYNTNLTVLPDRVLELWGKFQLVRVGVSLDGAGAIDEYIRFPSKWSVVEKNMHRLDQAAGPIDAWISATVQIYNIFHLPEMIMWRMQSGFRRLNSSKRLPILTSHPLHRPLHLNVQTLPPEVKTRVIQRFEEFKKEFHAIAPSLKHPTTGTDVLRQKVNELLDGYVQFMNRKDHSQHFPEFLKYTRKLDGIRGQDFERLCPEIF